MNTLYGFNITVSRQKLLAVLQENRRKHIDTYLVAVEEYRQALRIELVQRLEDLPDLTNPARFAKFSLPVPVSYEDVYSSVIDMLDFSVDENVTLTAEQHRCWVKDQWDWSKDFIANTLAYSSRR